MAQKTLHYWLPHAARHFEVNRNREVRRMNWFAMPTDLSSELWIELSEHPDGAAHIGVFIAAAMLASRGTPRWHLLDELGRPHSEKTIARVSRLPSALVTQAFQRFLSIGQVAIVPQETATAPQQGATLPQETATAPQQGAQYREEKREEERREEGAHSPATAPHPSATLPQETATAPQQGATLPQETATAPQQGATLPQETATAPQQGAQYREEKREEERREEGAHSPATAPHPSATLPQETAPDLARFQAEYPKPVSQLEAQLFISAVNTAVDEALLFANLEAFKQSEAWENVKYVPSAKRWLSEGIWRTRPANEEPEYKPTPTWRPEDYL